jgi:hypothetical protein
MDLYKEAFTMAKFSPNELKRKIREAQRKAQQQVKLEVDGAKG